jgi:hypothetical protein
LQILWDTLAWAPGAYCIEIDHDEGWSHEIALEKLAEGVKPPAPPASPPEPAEPDAPPITYRDGFGNVIQNTDLEMREAAREDIAKKFSAVTPSLMKEGGPRLEFEGNYRSGTIIYIDGDRRISFWHEMAGGKYHFFIDVPPPDQWEAATKTPLAEREAIVRFVAEQTRRQQAPSWQYEIKDREIVFY